jgi:hypothetical protein
MYYPEYLQSFLKEGVHMKKFAGIVLAWLCMVGLSWGGVLGDVNGDGAVGLPEAVHALQVSSGIRPQGVEAQYDFAEYFMLGTRERRTKTYRDQASGGSYTSQGISVVTKETVDGKEYYFDGYSYDQITPQGVFWIGDKGSTGIVWYDPPILLGSRNMSPGDVYTAFYEHTPGIRTYRESTFLGTEDVTTPAGFFPDCLKMLVKYHGSGPGTAVRYYAHGVGKVKEDYISLTSSYSYSRELVSASIGGNVIPANVVYYTGSGTWTHEGGSVGTTSGTFTWRFILGNLPAWGTLILHGFYPSIDPLHPSTDKVISLNSADGLNFTGWNMSAGMTCNLTLTPDGMTMGGSYTINEESTTFTGTYRAE